MPDLPFWLWALAWIITGIAGARGVFSFLVRKELYHINKEKGHKDPYDSYYLCSCKGLTMAAVAGTVLAWPIVGAAAGSYGVCRISWKLITSKPPLPKTEKERLKAEEERVRYRKLELEKSKKERENQQLRAEKRQMAERIEQLEQESDAWHHPTEEELERRVKQS
jgi:hypothetical protein